MKENEEEALSKAFGEKPHITIYLRLRCVVVMVQGRLWPAVRLSETEVVLWFSGREADWLVSSLFWKGPSIWAAADWYLLKQTANINVIWVFLCFLVLLQC